MPKKGSVRIKVTHPGILRVPEGKHVWNLRKKDIEALIKKEGYAPISRAINNLYIWNRKKKTDTAKKIMEWVTKAKRWLDDFRDKYGYKARRRATASEIGDEYYYGIDILAGSIVMEAQDEDRSSSPEQPNQKPKSYDVVTYQNINEILSDKNLVIGTPKVEKIYKFYIVDKPMKVETDTGIKECKEGDFILVTPSKRLFVIDKALGFYIFDFQG